MKWVFIVLCVYLGTLFFRDERIPGAWLMPLANRFVPDGLVVRFDAVTIGFRGGVGVRGLEVAERGEGASSKPILRAGAVACYYLRSRLRIEDLEYAQLPSGYYAPGNVAKDEPVRFAFPDLPPFTLELVRPRVLGVAPERVVAGVSCTPQRLAVERIRLNWPDRDEPMALDGFCTVDLGRQVIDGEVDGTAKQAHIRPLLEALDVPVSLPYMDAFTEVPGPIPARCGWHVNLKNNDFDLDLDLRPKMGRYNLVPMKQANGKLHLHVYTRDDHLNYRHTFGPIVGVGRKDEPLEGTVWVSGTNGQNQVDVEMKSALPVAHLLRIGGFTGEYVGEDVVGQSSCRLQFRFPRAMTNNYEVMNGFGHLSIRDGQVMRLKGFAGLLALLAEKVPGFSILTDSTQASCDYVIKDGVLKSDNIYIEGTVFSIKMYGTFDLRTEALNFTVRVQFAKKDSVVGKIIQPITWPFTKLLLEFRLTGTSGKPKWGYLSVLDRVLEVAK